HFKTTAQGITIHRRNDRLPTGGTVRNTPKATLRRAHHIPAVLSRIFQVVASRKRLVASPCEDPDPDLRITLKIVPDLVQLEMRRRVERVQALRTIQRHDSNAALFFIRGEFVGHITLVLLLVCSAPLMLWIALLEFFLQTGIGVAPETGEILRDL